MDAADDDQGVVKPHHSRVQSELDETPFMIVESA
jgi:hypothetical protein